MANLWVTRTASGSVRRDPHRVDPSAFAPGGTVASGTRSQPVRLRRAAVDPVHHDDLVLTPRLGPVERPARFRAVSLTLPAGVALLVKTRPKHGSRA